MNERIRELWRDCVLKHTNDPMNWQMAADEFAQLIVKECVGILMKPEYAMNHPGELADYNRGWVNGRLLGIEHIEEYFGVEE